MNVIEMRNVHVGYGALPVVRDLTMDVAAGEVVVLLGANGAGKTTTLLTLSGLLKPQAGEIRVLGRPVRAGEAHRTARLGLAHVPEDRAIFPGLTVRQNLLLTRRRDAGLLHRVLSFFPELETYLDRPAGKLSGGEQQMLALGRAVASRPRVLLVDEMSLGLAPVVVQRQLPRLRDIARETGAAVLFVEQHVHLALTVADRGYVMSRGQIALSGTASELVERTDLLHTSYLGAS